MKKTKTSTTMEEEIRYEFGACDEIDAEKESPKNDDDFYSAMHAMFGISQHTVQKEKDTVQHENDRFLPLDLPSYINVNEMRSEQRVNEQMCNMQHLATITSMLLHVRHGYPMHEYFDKETQSFDIDPNPTFHA